MSGAGTLCGSVLCAEACTGVTVRYLAIWTKLRFEWVIIVGNKIIAIGRDNLRASPNPIRARSRRYRNNIGSACVKLGTASASRRDKIDCTLRKIALCSRLYFATILQIFHETVSQIGDQINKSLHILQKDIDVKFRGFNNIVGTIRST